MTALILEGGYPAQRPGAQSINVFKKSDVRVGCRTAEGGGSSKVELRQYNASEARGYSGIAIVGGQLENPKI